jgi:multisubunit Na+/H+ antiporter MnhE subunit
MQKTKWYFTLKTLWLALHNSFSIRTQNTYLFNSFPLAFTLQQAAGYNDQSKKPIISYGKISTKEILKASFQVTPTLLTMEEKTLRTKNS